MSTPNIGTNTELVPQAPQKLSAIPGLKTKIMAILAAVGLAASPDVEGAVTLTHSTPTLQPGASANVFQSTIIANLDLRQATNALALSSEGTSRMTVTIPTGQDGTLTVSWNSIIGVGNAPGELDNQGYAGTLYDVNLRAKFGLAGGTMTDFANFDNFNEAGLTADGTGLINGGNPLSMSQNFSHNFNVLSGQTYNVDFGFRADGTRGFVDSDNIQFSFEGIPEPSTVTLLGGGAAALLLRRRRKDETDDTKN